MDCRDIVNECALSIQFVNHSLNIPLGSRSRPLEHYKQKGRVMPESEERFLQLPIWTTKRAFQVTDLCRRTGRNTRNVTDIQCSKMLFL